jgi:hypothetical protein
MVNFTPRRFTSREGGWPGVFILMLRRKEKSWLLPGIESRFYGHLARSLAAISTQISLLKAFEVIQFGTKKKDYIYIHPVPLYYEYTCNFSHRHYII